MLLEKNISQYILQLNTVKQPNLLVENYSSLQFYAVQTFRMKRLPAKTSLNGTQT
jgi:hypothetical protein